MKQIIGVVLIIVGIGFGLYAGIWWAFIGGIVDVIEQIRAENMSAMAIAIGIAKVFFAELIGWVSAVIAIIPGMVLLND